MFRLNAEDRRLSLHRESQWLPSRLTISQRPQAKLQTCRGQWSSTRSPLPPSTSLRFRPFSLSPCESQPTWWRARWLGFDPMTYTTLEDLVFGKWVRCLWCQLNRCILMFATLPSLAPSFDALDQLHDCSHVQMWTPR